MKLAPIRIAWAFSGVLGLVSAGGVSAHHGFSGRYDLSSPVWIEGQVVSGYFGQPHAELTIQVADALAVPAIRPDMGAAASFLNADRLVVRPETRGLRIKVELPPTQQYFSLSGKIAVGDHVAVIAVRNCDTPHQLNVQWLRLPSGAIVARSGAMSYMVTSC